MSDDRSRRSRVYLVATDTVMRQMPMPMPPGTLNTDTFDYDGNGKEQPHVP